MMLRMPRPMMRPMMPPMAGDRDGPSGDPPITPAGRDGPQSVLLPYCPEQWPLVAAGIPQPDYLWTFQEASGNFVDVANSPGGVLTAGTNSLYQQSVSGWATKFFRINAEGVGGGAQAAISTLWNIGNQSLFVLMYAAIVSSSGNRCMFLGGGANGLQIQAVGAGQVACFCNSVQNIGTFVYENLTPTVYPFVEIYDRRGSGLVRVNTDKEQITGTWANLSDNVKGLGSNNISPPISMYCMKVAWVGTDAETMADRSGVGLGGRQVIADLGWAMSY